MDGMKAMPPRGSRQKNPEEERTTPPGGMLTMRCRVPPAI
jgi:hypothetical protein